MSNQNSPYDGYHWLQKDSSNNYIELFGNVTPAVGSVNAGPQSGPRYYRLKDGYSYSGGDGWMMVGVEQGPGGYVAPYKGQGGYATPGVTRNVYQRIPQPAPAPAPALAPAPAPEPAPKAPAFNLSDYTEPSSGENKGVGFLRQFIDSVNSRSQQDAASTSTKPELYDSYAADYDKRRRERANSFAPAAAPASTGEGQSAVDTTQPQGAGQYAEAAGRRQDERGFDRAQRIATGREPESTRFAGGRAFGDASQQHYDSLRRGYQSLSGRYGSSYPAGS